MRRHLVLIVVTAALAALVPGASVAGGPVRAVSAHGSTAGGSGTSQAPSIVLILTDDQRFDEVANMPIVQSELADMGMTFANGFVTDSLCCPSRTSILTGQYSHGTHVYQNSPPHGGFATFVTQKHEDRSTIATWLQAQGYRTALIGKYLNGYWPRLVNYVSPGWDVWDALALAGNGDGNGGYYDYTVSEDGTPKKFGSAPSDYSTDVFAGMASDFIHGTPDGQPLFLYFAPRAPHAPATPPARYADACAGLPPLRPPNYNEQDVSDKPAWVQQLPLLSRKRRNAADALHLAHCQSLLAVDDAVGTILSALQDTGRLSTTMIVFMSDNGFQFGEHRWVGKKAPYDESIRVPLIIRYDPLTGLTGQTNSDLALNIDLAPTFTALAGTTAPNADGVSLLPLLGGDQTGWRSDFLVEHWEGPFSQGFIPPHCAVRSDQYMYIEYNTGEEELYDMSADPYQVNNVAGDAQYAAIKASLHDRMVQLCSPPPPDFTP